MSVPLKPTYIHFGTWDDETRQHEAMAWMEKYTRAVDAKAWDHEPSSNWLTSDSVLHKSTGEIIKGGDASWTSMAKDLYGHFSSHLHDPQLLVCWEVDGGWTMLGVANVHWNLPVPGEGNKVKDPFGKEWDGAGPGAFRFVYKKTDAGIRLSETAIFANPTGAMVEMMKRGMLKPEDLAKSSAGDWET